MMHGNELTGPLAPVDVTDITAVLDHPERDRAWLESHGCRLGESLPDGTITVYFPAGTTKAEIVPRTQQCRFTVTLPDGARLREQSLRNMREGSLLIPLKTPNS